jgi:hypothetical protein
MKMRQKKNDNKILNSLYAIIFQPPPSAILTIGPHHNNTETLEPDKNK